MKVFISWSGKRSHYIAETLRDWLEQILQATDPWISSNIEKGKRWNPEISGKLEESKVGIICLTKDNLNSEWIHFEAGAISKTKDAHVCTFLYDVSTTDINPPLSDFQATINNKEEIFKLITTINTLIGETDGKMISTTSLESIFDKLWPDFEQKLKKTPKSTSSNTPSRSERELIEETLQTVRALNRNPYQFQPSYYGTPLAHRPYTEKQKELIAGRIQDFFSNSKAPTTRQNINTAHNSLILYLLEVLPEYGFVPDLEGIREFVINYAKQLEDE